MTGPRPTVDEREAVFRRHLRALGDAPLLTAGEELAKAALVADGRAAEMELAALVAEDVPDFEEAANLRQRAKDGEAARATLIASTRRLVVSLARRHGGDGDRSAVLLAAGDDALSRAVDRYDPTGGLPFSAFARWWVERAMREVERHPSGHAAGPVGPTPVDPTLLTALGHLHQDDCRVVELRLGLNGGPALSAPDTARVLGVEVERAEERELRALAKLRHPSTPGDLTHLRQL
ncbi:MAG: polymerase, sigma 70 subunit, RpoD subfamily [Acidimicrobiales bacterium]|nr:polymerase, sigma 70 subunit, RpoD subfamily [Acidimicrobiales bacterium]